MLKRIALSTLALSALLAAQTIKKVPVTQTSPVDGKAMYTEYCAVCHGPDGRGNGPAAPALKKPVTDLTKLAMNNKGNFPEAKVSHAIEGDPNLIAHGSLDMPVWGNLFKSLSGSTESIVRMRVVNLTEYVRSLQTK
jgi:mono/diheme cytochrome c family protein